MTTTDHRSEHLDAIRADLTKAVDQAHWAWGLCWENPGRGLDAERGTVHKPPTPEELEARQANPDAVDGPTHDIGVGSHRARQAYQAAVKAVGEVDFRLSGMLMAEGTRVQPRLTELDPYAHPRILAKAARSALWRADRLQHPERHGRRLADLRTRLDTAVRGLSPVLDHGPADDIAHAEDAQPDRGIPEHKRCVICKRRARAKKGGQRCNTCKSYLNRHGEERPTYLDGINPHEAQAKRLARGESYGVA